MVIPESLTPEPGTRRAGGVDDMSERARTTKPDSERGLAPQLSSGARSRGLEAGSWETGAGRRRMTRAPALATSPASLLNALGSQPASFSDAGTRLPRGPEPPRPLRRELRQPPSAAACYLPAGPAAPPHPR